MAKITKATFKSFLRKNEGKIQILVNRKFDGMTDGCEPTGQKEFVPLQRAERVWENNLGWQGIWLVGGSRDYFTAYNKNNMTGIEVYNCCGSFVVAVCK